MAGMTEEQKKSIIEASGLDEKRLKEGTDTILEWCSQEEHLKDAVPYLAKITLVQRQLIVSQGSVEDAKQHLDNLLRVRYTLPELCQDLSLNDMGNTLKYTRMIVMPKLCPSNQERLYIVQMLPTENYDDFGYLYYLKLMYFIMEQTVSTDIAISSRYIFDFKNTKIGLLGKINLAVVNKYKPLTEAHRIKTKGIHIVNAPPFVDKISFLFKQVLKAKVAERMYTHQSIEDLYKDVPKECLPADYGGTEPSVEQLFDSWKEKLQTEESKQKLKDLEKVVSDETRRLHSKLNEEQHGMPGSFRKLDLD